MMQSSARCFIILTFLSCRFLQCNWVTSRIHHTTIVFHHQNGSGSTQQTNLLLCQSISSFALNQTVESKLLAYFLQAIPEVLFSAPAYLIGRMKVHGYNSTHSRMRSSFHKILCCDQVLKGCVRQKFAYGVQQVASRLPAGREQARILMYEQVAALGPLSSGSGLQIAQSRPQTKFFARALRPCGKIGSGQFHYENWGKFTYDGQVNWVIVVVDYIIRYWQRLLWRPKICKLAYL